MLYYLIPLIVIIISILLMIFIVVRKLPQLAAINVETIAKEKETKVKNRIIIDRLARRFSQLKKLLIYLFEPLVKSLQITGTKIYEKTLELEKKESKLNH